MIRAIISSASHQRVQWDAVDLLVDRLVDVEHAVVDGRAQACPEPEVIRAIPVQHILYLTRGLGGRTVVVFPVLEEDRRPAGSQGLRGVLETKAVEPHDKGGVSQVVLPPVDELLADRVQDFVLALLLRARNPR